MCAHISEKLHIIFLKFSSAFVTLHAMQSLEFFCTYYQNDRPVYDGKRPFYERWLNNNTSAQGEVYECFLIKALFLSKSNSISHRRVKDWFLSSASLCRFPSFSVEIVDVFFPPARQVNQIFCYICFVITCSQAIKHWGSSSGFLGPLERPCATSNNAGWLQFNITLFALS